ncbi:MAG: F0F1 ATP synthase subunit A [Calditrichota bacterium]
MTEHTSGTVEALHDTLHAAASVTKHVAASAAEHGAEHSESIGAVVLHHLTNIKSVELPWLHEGRFIEIDLQPLHWDLFGIDMSITKPVLFMWLAGTIILASMLLAFRRGLMRNRFAHLLEVYILFVRNEVVYPILGEKDGRRLLPFFLTVFFFVLTCNLLGLVPYGSTATANVNVTAGLAIIAFLTIQGMGIAKNGFIGHFKALVPPGLPAFVIPIMIPVEIVGMLAKPFALCIRLFANMVAGHAVIIVLLLLIIKSYITAPAPVFGILFISSLELFVAHLQAFIFTILTCIFTAMTMHPGH